MDFAEIEKFLSMDEVYKKYPELLTDDNLKRKVVAYFYEEYQKYFVDKTLHRIPQLPDIDRIVKEVKAFHNKFPL